MNNAPAYVFIVAALIGLLTMIGNVSTFDVGTMENPRVISLRK